LVCRLVDWRADIFMSEKLDIQCESKNPPLRLSVFFCFHERLIIFNRFLTHLLYVPIYARLQIFIQLSPSLTLSPSWPTPIAQLVVAQSV